uniref:Uncharacterized protein n=1 Tax=Arundo donax TaxID=35708 RepID=A0A0A9A2S1_ARUDO
MTILLSVSRSLSITLVVLSPADDLCSSKAI